MKFVKLAQSARVNGVLRHPHEGVLHLEDDESQRIIDNKEGVDVSADFDGGRDEAAAVDNLDAAPKPAPDLEPVRNQSEAAPLAAEEATTDKPARKGKASKE